MILRDVAGEPGALPLLSHALRATWELRDGRTLTVEGYRDTGGVSSAIARTADRIVQTTPDELHAAAQERVPPAHRDRRRRRRHPTPRRHRRTRPRGRLHGRSRHASSNDSPTPASSRCEKEPPRSPTRPSSANGPRSAPGSKKTAKDCACTAASATPPGSGPQAATRHPTSTGEPASRPHANGRETKPEALNATERAFLDASLELADRERADQAHRVRRLRRLLAGVALALVVALVAGTFAVVQRSRASRAADRAQRQAEVADATRLAAQAASLGGERLDLALNLAVEGHQLHPTVETEGALKTVLAATPAGLERLVHFDPPATFAGISHDGGLLAAPGEDGAVRLIDTGSGHEVRRLVGHRHRRALRNL